MLADKQYMTIAIIGLEKIEKYIFIDRKLMWLILENILFSPTIATKILSIGYLDQKQFRIIHFNGEA